ncbi:hypothetical protein L0F63_007377 [Massospora cicadina]|nr:hypothetical protein L0F63_007377 [Massospora cicadina]
MQRRATSKKRAAEAEKEVDMGDKEATPVEDLEVLLTPVEPKQPAPPEEQPERMEELREDNQLLREELREVNQENMNKLDERIELAKEELNRKITDTKKSIVKKLEQEVVVVNQQIREVDERCRQTECEVLEVRECEHMSPKDATVEAAMTNITGQVRQSQEEIERKPMEFLARIEEYMDKHRGNRWVQNRELLDESFREVNDHWWMANRSDIESYQQFKSLFKAKYWSETTQNLIRTTYATAIINSK